MAIEVVQNGGFEAGLTGWDLYDEVNVAGVYDVNIDYGDLFPAYDGTKILVLYSVRSSFGPTIAGSKIAQVIDPAELRSTDLVVRYHTYANPQPKSPTFTIVDLTLGVVIYGATLDGVPDVWHEHDVTFVPTGPYRIEIELLPPDGNGNAEWHFDGISGLYMSSEDIMARSTMASFLTRLQMLIEALDPNIGQVHQVRYRWMNESMLRQHGHIVLASGSILDATTRTGANALRFWILEPVTDTEPLTNGSAQYNHTVNVYTFYQYESDGQQEATLRAAVTEFLDKLNTRTVELVDFSTGPSYLGYLGRRPTMVAPIEQAVINDLGIQGHLARTTVHFSEEVTYDA